MHERLGRPDFVRDNVIRMATPPQRHTDEQEPRDMRGYVAGVSPSVSRATACHTQERTEHKKSQQQNAGQHKG